MNKSELIKAAAAKAEVSNALAAKVLDAAIEATIEAVKNQAARTAKNPRTGAVVNVPAKKVVKIKAGAKLAL